MKTTWSYSWKLIGSESLICHITYNVEFNFIYSLCLLMTRTLILTNLETDRDFESKMLRILKARLGLECYSAYFETCAL